MKDAPVEKHPFEPFLPEGARILFLGSFPPQPHRWCMPFYYPNWINDFWRVMGLIHFGDAGHFCIVGEKRFDLEAVRAFCVEAGLAFYDTACEVRRLKDNASDAFLEVVTPTDIPALLARIPGCRTVVTTGQKATETLAATLRCPLPPIGGYIDLGLASAGTRLSSAGPHSHPGLDPGSHTSPSLPSAAPHSHPGLDPGSHTSPSLPSAGTHSHPGLDPGSPTPLRFWRMPSTSRAYPLPLEAKAAAYRKLF